MTELENERDTYRETERMKERNRELERVKGHMRERTHELVVGNQAKSSERLQVGRW